MATTEQPYWIDPLDFLPEVDEGPSTATAALDDEAAAELAKADVLVDLFDMSDLLAEKPEGWTDEAWQQYLEDVVPASDKELSESSFIYFVFHYLTSHLSNKFSPAHYDLAELLQDPTPRKRILWLFPREHAKTTIVTFAYTLWCICFNKKRNIIICSDAKSAAQEFLRNIKTELVNNDKIRNDFGDLQGRQSPKSGDLPGKWDEQHIITANGVQVKIWSPNSQVRGLQYNQPEIEEDEWGERRVINRIIRPDLVILDDILNDSHVQNKEARDKLENWFFTAVFNAVDSETGDIVAIGTLLHFDDLLSRLWKDEEKTAGWTKRKTPACVIGDDGVPRDSLWPDRWGPEKLLERRTQIGSLAFAKEFLLNPREDEAAYFRHEWFQFYADHTVPQEWLPDLFDKRQIEPLPRDMLICTGIDPNTKDKDKLDYTVVMTLGFCPTTRGYYVIDVARSRPSPEQQVMEMIRQAMRWGRQYRDDDQGWFHEGFIIETVAYQATIKYWLKKYADMHGLVDAKYYERNEGGVDKTVRCAVMSPMAEQRRLYFPIGVRTNPLSQEKHYCYPYQWLQDELNDFPMGSYDDGVDAMQRCYSRLIREERKYVTRGRYGPSAVDGFERMVASNKTLKQYLNEKGF